MVVVRAADLFSALFYFPRSLSGRCPTQDAIFPSVVEGLDPIAVSPSEGPLPEMGTSGRGDGPGTADQVWQWRQRGCAARDDEARSERDTAPRQERSDLQEW